MNKPCPECDLLGYRACDCLGEDPPRLTDFHPGVGYWLDPEATLQALRDMRAER